MSIEFGLSPSDEVLLANTEAGVTETTQRQLLELTDPLTSQIEFVTDLFERARHAVVEAVPQSEDSPLTLGEAFDRLPQAVRDVQFLGHAYRIHGFLVFDAVVTVVGTAGASTVPLGDILDDPELAAGGIITGIAVPAGGRTASDRTGRTPADRPIVMVAGRLDDAGTLRLVATGVAANPAPIDLDALDELDPPGDFRGSSGYRRHLAGVLGARVVRELQGGSS
jgi:hypothetical protein